MSCEEVDCGRCPFDSELRPDRYAKSEIFEAGVENDDREEVVLIPLPSIAAEL